MRFSSTAFCMSYFFICTVGGRGGGNVWRVSYFVSEFLYVRYEVSDQMKGGHRSKLKCGTREEAGNKGKSELKQKICTEVYPKLKNSMPNYLLPW